LIFYYCFDLIASFSLYTFFLKMFRHFQPIGGLQREHGREQRPYQQLLDEHNRLHELSTNMLIEGTENAWVCGND